MRNNSLKCLMISMVVITAALYNSATAQVDTTKAAQPDTALMAQPDTTAKEKEKKEKKDDDRKRKDEFILFAGVNFNQLSVESSDFGTSAEVGYDFGAAYKRGRFFYWQVGAWYNNSVYNLEDLNSTADSAANFAVRKIDIPVTGGINFLAFVNRLVALRLFVSAVPSFAIGVNDNDYNYGFKDLLQNDKSRPGQVFVNLGFRF